VKEIMELLKRWKEEGERAAQVFWGLSDEETGSASFGG